MPKSSWAPPKGMRGKCERRGGNINADGAGAEVFVGDGCSQGASFGPMVAISRRGQGGRIYNNTRTRERLRRKCVKPADLTTHSPPKTVTRPRTATRPSRAFSHPLPAHFRSLPQPRRTPAGCAMHSSPTSQHIPRRRSAPAPAQRRALPKHFRSPTQPRHPPADLTTHSPPKTFARPRTATRPSRAFSHPLPAHFHSPRSDDARPPTSRPIPRRRPSLAPAQRHALAEHFRSPTQRRRTPAGCAMHSPPPSQPIPRCATLPPLPFRFGHKKTAPHSACAMPNVSVDRRCGRSFGLVSRALFAAVAGRWRVGVGLRPQPWALRSRRCGRVLRA